MSEEKIRLQKLIADRGYCSRRYAEELIVSGKVFVNGECVKELGKKFCNDVVIAIDGKIIDKVSNKEKLYFAFNKPLEVISSLKDDRGRKTIQDFIPKEYGRLFPVGRLDYNTSGLILLTNDGEFANLVMHPSSEIEKTYEVEIKGFLSKEDINILETGVMLEDGMTAPSKITSNELLSNKHTLFHITIHEGKNREIRRMMQALNKELVSLKRISISTYQLGNLKKGEMRKLSFEEVNRIIISARNKK